MRRSFVIHLDSLDVLDDLSDQQCGELFRAIKSFKTNGELPCNPLIKIAFSQFKNQFMRDDEKYRSICEARAKAGSKGGKQKVANASKPKQMIAKLADNDNKSVNVNDNDSDSERIKDIVAAAPKFNFKARLVSLGVDQRVASDWLEVRRKKKAANTETAFNGLANQIDKSGLTANECIKKAVESSWAGFKAGWVSSQSTVTYTEETAF